MLRLKVELETCYAEDRADALRKAHEEHIEEVQELKEQLQFKEQMLRDEIDKIKIQLADKERKLNDANEKSDKQIMQIRIILDKSERNHQREINAEINEREELISKELFMVFFFFLVDVVPFITLYFFFFFQKRCTINLQLKKRQCEMNLQLG